MSPSQYRNGQAELERTLPFTSEEVKTAPAFPVAPIEQFTGRNMSLAVGTRTNPGIKRQHKPNEDSLFAAQGERIHNSNTEQFGLFVVADGMGGHANGQDASRLAIQTIVDRVLPKLSGSEQLTDDGLTELLVDGVKEANLAVHQRNMEDRADMGTTMTATLIVGATAYIANVGDSRTYLYRRPEGLKKITNDHSVVASLVEAGIIKPEDIYTHTKRNQIYRSLGEKPSIDVDSFIVLLKPGDELLLCSDGLWEMVRDPAIEQILGSVPDPMHSGNALIKAALEGGGDDNVSVIVVYINETSQRTGMTGIQLLARPEAPQYPPM
jgi:serine/threonine protein phosphatase PrpC